MLFLSGEKTLQILSGQDSGPNVRSAGCHSSKRFEVELLFLDFLSQPNTLNRHRRRLEALEPEHRPDSLLYSPVILLDHIVQNLQDRTCTRRGKIPEVLSLVLVQTVERLGILR